MLSEFFRLSSLAWEVGLSATGHVYTGGRLSARVQQARAEAEEARLGYQQIVLRAFQNVEDGFINYITEGQRDVTLKAAAEDSELTFQRSTRLYKAGLTDFLHSWSMNARPTWRKTWRRKANSRASSTQLHSTKRWEPAGSSFIPPMRARTPTPRRSRPLPGHSAAARRRPFLQSVLNHYHLPCIAVAVWVEPVWSGTSRSQHGHGD